MGLLLLFKLVECNILHSDNWLVSSSWLVHIRLGCIWKVMVSTTLPKSASLMHLWNAISFRADILVPRFVHSFCSSQETVSSHPVFSLHNFWMILLHFKINGMLNQMDHTLNLIHKHTSLVESYFSRWILQICRYFLFVGLNLVVQQFLWKTSGGKVKNE